MSVSESHRSVLGVVPQDLSTLGFVTGLLTVLELTNLVRLALSSGKPPVSISTLPVIINACWESNSDPHVCLARILQTEPSFQALIQCIFYWKNVDGSSGSHVQLKVSVWELSYHYPLSQHWMRKLQLLHFVEVVSQSLNHLTQLQEGLNSKELWGSPSPFMVRFKAASQEFIFFCDFYVTAIGGLS